MKKRVLFLCTHNSCRSQMAEALLRDKYGDFYEVYSAGTEKKTVNPYAIKVLEELGVDMSSHYSKTTEEIPQVVYDIVVTVCDNARKKCPFFPGAIVEHHSFEDPSEFQGSEIEKMTRFRTIRDEIKKWIDEYFNTFGKIV